MRSVFSILCEEKTHSRKWKNKGNTLRIKEKINSLKWEFNLRPKNCNTSVLTTKRLKPDRQMNLNLDQNILNGMDWEQ